MLDLSSLSINIISMLGDEIFSQHETLLTKFRRTVRKK